MVRPGSRGDSCLDADHGVKGLDRFAAAKPPLTPWSASKILVAHAIQALLQASTATSQDLCADGFVERRPGFGSPSSSCRVPDPLIGSAVSRDKEHRGACATRA